MVSSARWGSFIPVEIFEELKKPLQQVEEFLQQAIRSPVQSITDMSRHLLSAGGKRLRPTLTLLSSQLVSDITQRTIMFAGVVELMHMATLIHDDVIDKSVTRRGRLTVHQIWGNEAAIMCGDHLYAKAFNLLAQDGDLNVIRMMAETSRRICEGEILELQLSFQPDITEKQCLEIVNLKTAELISASCQIGALVNGRNNNIVEALRVYGQNLGIAFQIVDDILDLESSWEELGKPVGSDFLEGKITLPIKYALSSLSAEERNQWQRLISERLITIEDAQKIASIAKQKGALDKARAVANDYAHRARCALQFLQGSCNYIQNKVVHFLEGATDFVVRRKG